MSIRNHSGVDPLFITAYGSKLVVDQDPGEGSGAKQSFAAECDINNIMAKYQRTGVLEWLNKHEGRYGDAVGMDYAQAMATVAAAESMFEDLPSSMRQRFENDAGKFVQYLDDPRNDEEAIAWGLKIRKVVTPDSSKVPDLVPPSKP